MVGTAQAATGRTLLEQRIRDRKQTFEEFAEFAENFARDHGEPGTLSVRHLQRLVAGRQLGQLRPATARLLERIFDTNIAELLGPPRPDMPPGAPEALRVAVAVVVKDADVLIVRRRADSGSRLSWQFPAGFVKPGANVEYVAVSETLSETAVHCIPTRPLGRRIHPETRVICEYVLCDYVAGHATNSDIVENSSVLWVAKSRVTRLIPVASIYPPVLRALAVAD